MVDSCLGAVVVLLLMIRPFLVAVDEVAVLEGALDEEDTGIVRLEDEAEDVLELKGALLVTLETDDTLELDTMLEAEETLGLDTTLEVEGTAELEGELKADEVCELNDTTDAALELELELTLVLALVLTTELETDETMLDGELDVWVLDWLLETDVMELEGMLEAVLELDEIRVDCTVDDCTLE